MKANPSVRAARLRKGFTLLELMVVVGIIGILSAIMLKTVGGSSDSARNAKCLAHMHTLAAACHSVGMSEDHYPAAGSREYRWRLRKSSAGGGDRERYFESKGWISWYSRDAYPIHKTASDGHYRYATGHKASSSWFISTYSENQEAWHYCLTNGAIWQAVNASASAYVCPLHQVKAKKWGVEPHWSYVMNSAFGYDPSVGAKAHISTGRRGFTSFKKSDRTLLFAELPFNDENTSQQVRHASSSGIEFDPTLQYQKEKPTADETSFHEIIGFNHKSKRKWIAHVCFADGHTEKLEMPGDASQARLRELTQWLCEGTDITYDGTKYEELTK